MPPGGGDPTSIEVVQYDYPVLQRSGKTPELYEGFNVDHDDQISQKLRTQ